ncbi:hypothetical protein BDR26DRAFT_361545 [Obelidium mucronatum]|nr:hypothetical protein BDR26DRAFT_361545 [Obelidium mucronatum]
MLATHTQRPSHGIYATAFASIKTDAEKMAVNIDTALESVSDSILDLAAFDEAHADIGRLLESFRALLDAKAAFRFRAAAVDAIQRNLVAGRNADGSALDDDDDDADDEEKDEKDAADKLLARFAAAHKGDVLAPLVAFDAVCASLVRDKMAKYNKQSHELKYHKLQEYVELRKKMAEICEAGPYANPIGDPMDEDEDDDLAIVGEQTNYKCPITQTIMNAEIFTSKKCSHSFSSAIHEIIRRSDPNAECPVAGCNKYIRTIDLFRDKVMERKAKIYLRKKADEEDEENSQRRPATQVLD